jgi:hypothetical protein
LAGIVQGVVVQIASAAPSKADATSGGASGPAEVSGMAT